MAHFPNQNTTTTTTTTSTNYALMNIQHRHNPKPQSSKEVLAVIRNLFVHEKYDDLIHEGSQYLNEFDVWVTTDREEVQKLIDIAKRQLGEKQQKAISEILKITKSDQGINSLSRQEHGDPEQGRLSKKTKTHQNIDNNDNNNNNNNNTNRHHKHDSSVQMTQSSNQPVGGTHIAMSHPLLPPTISQEIDKTPLTPEAKIALEVVVNEFMAWELDSVIFTCNKLKEKYPDTTGIKLKLVSLGEAAQWYKTVLANFNKAIADKDYSRVIREGNALLEENRKFPFFSEFKDQIQELVVKAIDLKLKALTEVKPDADIEILTPEQSQGSRKRRQLTQAEIISQYRQKYGDEIRIAPINDQPHPG